MINYIYVMYHTHKDRKTLKANSLEENMIPHQSSLLGSHSCVLSMPLLCVLKEWQGIFPLCQVWSVSAHSVMAFFDQLLINSTFIVRILLGKHNGLRGLSHLKTMVN